MILLLLLVFAGGNLSAVLSMIVEGHKELIAMLPRALSRDVDE
jgi:hypothetical protein